MKTKIETRFKKLFPGCRLLAVHLDGFSHSVFFDQGARNTDVTRIEWTGCAPELHQDQRAADLFKGIGHAGFQGQPQELIYIMPGDR